MHPMSTGKYPDLLPLHSLVHSRSSLYVLSSSCRHACYRLAPPVVSPARCEFRAALHPSCNLPFRYGRQINVRLSHSMRAPLSRCCRVNPDAGLSPTVDTRSWDGNIDVKRSRLLYRARQTGWLETDLLCGAFASGVRSMQAPPSKLFAHSFVCSQRQIFD